MRRSRLTPAIVVVLFAVSSGVAVAVGCSAGGERHEFTTGGGEPTSTSNAGGGGSNTGGMGGEAGGLVLPDAGGDAPPDVPMNPCGTECGPEELCDTDHLGLDDDCDTQVDETCPCVTGQAHFCFKGDPSYYNTPGCFPGTEKCDENGNWGPCIGGVHATDLCFDANPLLCHPIQAPPFSTVDLKDGTGNFSADAVAGSEVWTVTCPSGVNPCPAVSGTNPPDDFQPLQSGEYTVTYTKGLVGGGTDTCTYPLFVGAPGLRVELEWEHNLGGDGVDLDLHVHQPEPNTSPWAISGSAADCGFANCTINAFSGGFSSINWFSDTATPPDAVNWYLDPVLEKNTCYFAPRGVGQLWQNYGQGCHNPRLDIDNIYCNASSTNPQDYDFCAPENINIDFPPPSTWTRVGVHYYSSHGFSYNVHPNIKIYCHGALAAELGSTGFYDPEMPVTFTPSDSSTRFWLVADVAFTEGECGTQTCVVQPLYQDANTKTPLLSTQSSVTSSFQPTYPPPP